MSFNANFLGNPHTKKEKKGCVYHYNVIDLSFIAFAILGKIYLVKKFQSYDVLPWDGRVVVGGGVVVEVVVVVVAGEAEDDPL